MARTKKQTKPTAELTFEQQQKIRNDAWIVRMIEVFGNYRYPQIRFLVQQYERIQDFRKSLINITRSFAQIGSQLEWGKEVFGKTPEEVESYIQKTQKLYETEEVRLGKEMEIALKGIPIYTDYLSKIRGVSTILSAKLIAYIQDAGKFDTPSALMRYCGVSADDAGFVQRARRQTKCPKCGSPEKTEPKDGKRFCANCNYEYQGLGYSPALKTLMFNIQESFMRAKHPVFRRLYDEAHAKYLKRGIDKSGSNGANKNLKHLQLRSYKKPQRIFLALLWTKWRELDGLSTVVPYPEGIQGHAPEHMIKPEDVIVAASPKSKTTVTNLCRQCVGDRNIFEG